MAIKGYVVRGMAPGDVLHEEARDALGAAVGTWTALVQLGAARPRIFRVHPDGREERLPSYEEALALLCADPLTALEAAERRLLEAGGWRPSGDADYPGYWRDRDGRMFKQAVAILAERRRLAAKGGA
jgi:hypothetical protein